MNLKAKMIKHKLVSGYVLKDSDLFMECNVPSWNFGANVFVCNDVLFFVSDSGDLCMMSMDVAKWFNWNDIINADLSDLVIDLDDPFPVSVYFNPNKYKRSV